VTAAQSEYLLALAALALSFVGFSAIVVTLRGALGGELSPRHIRLVCLYIEGGLLVTALALAPALLNVLGVESRAIWRLCSVTAALVFAVFLLIQARRRRAVEAGNFPAWVIVTNVVSAVTVLALVLNALGAPFGPSMGPYAAVLTWALSVFGFIFIRTIELFLHKPS
jgi:hypothetical protein